MRRFVSMLIGVAVATCIGVVPATATPSFSATASESVNCVLHATGTWSRLRVIEVDFSGRYTATGDTAQTQTATVTLKKGSNSGTVAVDLPEFTPSTLSQTGTADVSASFVPASKRKKAGSAVSQQILFVCQ